VTVGGDVKQRLSIGVDTAGLTLSSWVSVKVRPTTRVGGRRPAPGDRVTIDGHTRVLTAVEPVRGPGTALTHLVLTAGA
jgi:hypothetical protein